MLNLNNTMIPFLPLFTAAFAVILCSIVPVCSAPLPTFKNLWNPHDPTEGFKKCGREVHGSKSVGFKYGTCACDGLVIYGNNRNGYVNRTVKSGCVPCTNGVFPNRIGGGKQCFCKGSTTRDYYDSSVRSSTRFMLDPRLVVVVVVVVVFIAIIVSVVVAAVVVVSSSSSCHRHDRCHRRLCCRRRHHRFSSSLISSSSRHLRRRHRYRVFFSSLFGILFGHLFQTTSS